MMEAPLEKVNGIESSRREIGEREREEGEEMMVERGKGRVDPAASC